ncbi:prepilin-type N-terminal cleavage/methylation domain-containing protein [Chitinivibrio alkaliphilus]|uniref:Prepilin-type N-terminal cleavage/methylation domain-containing protein n=1 Tax=Chitinivibrio alkaliphilus ACht1 TaxID=1313304 RepID=U7D9L5_9BACT|nr:prepilin-type N-terminal cleavage/methylation domain-containing protein [Chitinivibrio alkaliphilus]ERP39084.1 hypothetical protein CALK_0249 [Chitinivibrio alkaliphilus ACht1]
MGTTRVKNSGFSVAEVMIAMVVLGIGITVATSTMMFLSDRSGDTQESNVAYELTRQKLVSLTGGSSVVERDGSDSPQRDGVTYDRSWEVDDSGHPAVVTVTTAWQTRAGRSDSVRLTGYIRGDVCPDIENNDAPDSLEIRNEEGEVVDHDQLPLVITIPEGGTSGIDRFVAELIGHDPDSAEGDFAQPSLEAGEADNDHFRIVGRKLHTAEALSPGSYTVDVLLTDCFGETLSTSISVHLVEAVLPQIEDAVLDTLFEQVSDDPQVERLIPKDTVLHTMEVNNASRAQISWSIVGGNPDSIFGIRNEQPHKGRIYVRAPEEINYDEGVQEYSLQIQGLLGDLSGSATVTIPIGDVIQTPESTALTNTTIEAGSPQGTVVGVFETEDPDIDADHSYEVYNWDVPVGDLFAAVEDTLVVNASAGVPADFSGSTEINVETRDREDTETSIQTTFFIEVTPAPENGENGDDTGESEGSDPCAGVDEWPLGSYSIGDLVVNNGKLWECINAGQGHREPSGPHGDHGWEEINVCAP